MGCDAERFSGHAALDDDTLFDLIDLVYETAEHPKMWPLLLEQLIGLLEDPVRFARGGSADGGSAVASVQAARDQLIGALLPHCQRSLRIAWSIARLQQEREAALAVLARLPLAVVLVDADGRVLTMNDKAQRLIHQSSVLCVRDHRLCFRSAQENTQLCAAIGAAVGGADQASEGEAIIRWGAESDPAGGSLLVLAGASPGDAHAPVASGAAILIASPEIGACVSEASLRQLYQLTPAEARLARLLVGGKSVNQAARALGIQPQTARSQLKAVFAKTGTHRQAELVHRVFTSPAMVAEPDVMRHGSSAARPMPAHAAEPGRESTLRLRDGRRLAYAQYGDPQGVPVLFCHSIMASRLQRPVDETLLAELGIRFIVPDRPGYGGSDALPGRRLTDWPADAEALLDVLDIDRFHVCGCSCGGAYAAACADALGARVLRLGLFSSMAPWDSLSQLKGMAPTSRFYLGLARYAPALLGPLLKALARQALIDPAAFYEKICRSGSLSDQLISRQPEYRRQGIDNLREAFRTGWQGMVDDVLAMVRPWGFDPAALEQEMQIHHGEADEMVPLSLLDALQRAPRARLKTYPDEGHFFFLRRWRPLLEELVSGADRPVGREVHAAYLGERG